MLTAIVNRNSIRMVALVDHALYHWFKNNLPVFETIPVRSTGYAGMRTENGFISYVYAIGINDQGKNVEVHMIQRWPDEISLDEAYEILAKNTPTL